MQLDLEGAFVGRLENVAHVAEVGAGRARTVRTQVFEGVHHQQPVAVGLFRKQAVHQVDLAQSVVGLREFGRAHRQTGTQQSQGGSEGYESKARHLFIYTAFFQESLETS